MRKIEIATTRPPYGIGIVARRDGIHLRLKSPTGEQNEVVMPRAVAESLRAELDAALALDDAAVG
jgi:hypothetical protein